VSLRILITGSRNWTNRDTISRAIIDAIDHHGTHLITHNENGPTLLWDQVTLVHGAARGADHIAGRIARAWGMRIEEHPADWDRHGKSAGSIRNTAMVQLGANVCLAFPIGRSIGTRHCMRLANAAGIPVRCYEPAPHAPGGYLPDEQGAA
jgi:YspA, cpYpsA-related SLOG family